MSNSVPIHEDHNSISSFLFTGTVGALTSRSVQWLSDRVNDLSGWHLGKTLDAIMPTQIRKIFTWCAKNLQYPIDRPKNRIQDLFITEDERINLPDGERERREGRRDLFIKVVYAPVLEEIVYRGAVQTGISVSLGMLGTHPIVSKTISVFCTTVMFGIAHEKKLRKNPFTSSAVAGTYPNKNSNHINISPNRAKAFHASGNLSQRNKSLLHFLFSQEKHLSTTHLFLVAPK